MMTLVQSIFLVLVIIIFLMGVISYRNWYHINKSKITPLQSKKVDKDEALYNWAQPTAKRIKIILQMFLGIGLLVLVLVKLFCAGNSCQWIPVIGDVVKTYQLADLQVLEIVGTVLAYASAVELAYTLFTPGPDEVIDPLLMGLSAAILLGTAQINDLTLAKAGATALYVLVLAGLFVIRGIFIKGDTEDDTTFARMLKRQQARYIWPPMKKIKNHRK